MKRLLPVVVLTVTAGAACALDLQGLGAGGSGPGSGSVSATTSSLAGPGGAAATASSGGMGGDPSTSAATTASATTATATSSATTSAASSSSTGGGTTGWKRRRKLDLDHGQITPITNFPILVVLKSGRIDYGQTLNNGQDLRFVDESGNVLPHEIELWDEGGTSLVWVRVPLIKQKPDVSSLYMYYGNPDAADKENANGVWADNYRGVWHLNEGGETFTDSSGKTMPAAKNYGSTQLQGSIIGKGRSFKASSKQYIDTLNSEDLSTFTIEVWARGDKAPSSAGPEGPNGPLLREQNYQIVWDHDAPFGGSASFRAPGTQDWIAADLKPLSANTWYYLAATYDGTKLTAYKNGVKQAGEVTAGAPLSDSNTAKIGRHATASEIKHFFNGDIDEVRIAQGARTDRWIPAQYKSMTDGGFVTFGAETTGAWEAPLQHP